MAVGDKLSVVMGREKAVPSGVATLGADGILAEAQRPNLAQVGGSNPNLIINWDFRNPVNRNGKTEYSITGINKYFLDRWLGTYISATLEEDGLMITSDKTPSLSFYPKINNAKILAGKIVTLSFLVADAVSTAMVLRGDIGNGSINVLGDKIVTLNGPGLYTITGTLPDTLQKLYPGILVRSGGYCKAIAAKLEFGPAQTLARKNADGEWEIIDPHNYDLQYLLCSQYSPITGEWVGSQHSNPNLLDNWYFVGGGSQQDGGKFPINQRGKTEYSGAGYTIDRWKFDNNGALLSIHEGYVSISFSGAAWWKSFIQIITWVSSPTKLTASIMYKSSNPPHFITNNNILPVSDEWTVASFTGTFTPSSDGTLYTSPVLSYGESEIDIKALKIELGPVQTLAHKEGDTWVLNDPPPNFQQELAKCRRYLYNPFYGYANDYAAVGIGQGYSVTIADILLQTPIPMRAMPTLICSGTFALTPSNVGNADIEVTNIAPIAPTCNAAITTLRCTVAGGLTIGSTYILRRKNNAAAQLLLSAEL